MLAITLEIENRQHVQVKAVMCDSVRSEKRRCFNKSHLDFTDEYQWYKLA